MAKSKFVNLPGQSKGILDDFAVRKNLATREGTVEKVPVNDSDIANKKYVDDAISVEDLWDRSGTNTYLKNIGDKVGIGTTAPTQLLNVKDGKILLQNSGDTEFTIDSVGGSNNDSIIQFNENTVDRGKIYWDGAANDFVWSSTTGDISLMPSGNVGIGTTSPQTELNVVGISSPEIRISETSGALGATGKLTLLGYTGNNRAYVQLRGEFESSGDSHLSFWTTTNGGATLVEQMRIDDVGNVGIGTTNPDTKLQVVGDVKIGDDNTNYTSISTTGDQTFTGSAGFYPRQIAQDTEPAAGTGSTQIDGGEMAVWRDTNDSDKIFLMYNYNGTVYKVECG